MKDNKKFIEYFFVIALFCFGLCYYCFHILGFDLSRTPGDYGDSRFINYILEHGFKWLKGEDPDFWRASFMYPLKNNVAISDSMAGALPLYALFRFMGIGVETSYQLWWLSTCILNFWCCFIAFKKIGFNPFLSAIGAYVFAYGITNFNQFYHLQFNYKFCIPICIAAFYLFLKLPKTKYFVVFISAIVLQFYASAYLGILLIYVSAGFGVLYLLRKANRKLFYSLLTKKTVFQSGIAALAGFLLILVVAIPYQSMAERIGYRNYDTEVFPYLPVFYSYFFPSNNSIIWGFLSDSPVKQEPLWYLQDLFPGLFCYLGLLFFAGYSVKQLIQKRATDHLPQILFLICIICPLLFSKLSPDWSLFVYIRQLPGMASMRIMLRFMIINVFFMIWLSLYFINTLPEKKNIVIVLLTLLVITDNLFTSDPNSLATTPKETRETRVAAMCHQITTANVDHKKIIACINTNKDDPGVFMQLDVILACQRLNLYTLNGYSSTCVEELCNAYSDTAHVQLSAWLRKYNIPEKDVLFITHNGE